MTRTDSVVVGTLVVLFALIAGLVGLPALAPAVSPGQSAGFTPGSPVARPYREGVLGHPDSVSPLTARTQADRDLVALVFAGLVRNGPSGTIVADLAERWSSDASGTTWTFELRDDARWHDGEPVTAEDVVFTIRTLQDPAYIGPAAGSWNEVEVRAASPRTVVFTLRTALAGFLQAATQPIAPAHLLADVPAASLGVDPFGRKPVGAGPFALVSLGTDRVELVPAVTIMPNIGPSALPSAGPDSFATAAPTERPSRPTPYLPAMEFRYFDTPSALAAAYRSGDLDAASGLSPALTAELASAKGSRLVRYPGSTLTAVLLNLRPGRPEFADPAVRTALLAAIDRAALIDRAFAMTAGAASGLIPPSSTLFDPAADPWVRYDRAAARTALKKAGWTVSPAGWFLPKARKPLSIELISPDEASNPAAFAAAAAVAQDWKKLGLGVTHVPLPPGEFVTDRLATGTFSAAVADVNVGLDPDLYPLLASSQTLRGGSNVIGLQDPALDVLLVAARGPGPADARATVYARLQRQLAKGRYLLPLAFADESIVVRDTLQGMVVRQVSDPADRFWDVLTWRLAADR